MKVAAFLFYTLWLWGSGVFCAHETRYSLDREYSDALTKRRSLVLCQQFSIKYTIYWGEGWF